jgi:tricorn protease
VKSPFLARNDEEGAKDDAAGAEEEEASDADDAGANEPAGDPEAARDAEGKDAGPEPVAIDFDGIASRAIPLPLGAGSYRNLQAGEEKLYYLSGEPRGPGEDQTAELRLFDIALARSGEEGEGDAGAGAETGAGQSGRSADQSLIPAAQSYELSADGQSLLVNAQGGLYITGAAPGAALDKPVPLPSLQKQIDPYNEWRQMILEVWRSFREEFYDPGLHGVDWDGARDRALAMLPFVSCREDMSFLISEMVAELSVGHSYVWGAAEPVAGSGLGQLGCDFERAVDSAGRAGIRISRIYRGSAAELWASGPLSQPGVDVKEGSFLLAVNNVPVDPARSPYALLLGTAHTTVKLTIGDSALRDASTRDLLVTPLGHDGELRHQAWVEANRRYVYEQSGGRVGYIHVRDTQDSGITDLMRQFIGQHNMDALIIDERYNGGGFVAHRFIELLNRPTRIYDTPHYGKPMRFPRRSAPGAKVMLINQYAGSGGDGFPWLFRQSGLGRIVGVRTWGGWVSISPRPLLDGTWYVVPVVHGFEPNGSWMIEGYGVDPDIVQVNDPTSLARGRDLQLDKAIEVALAEADANPWRDPPRPLAVNRSGEGTLPEER